MNMKKEKINLLTRFSLQTDINFVFFYFKINKIIFPGGFTTKKYIFRSVFSSATMSDKNPSGFCDTMDCVGKYPPNNMSPLPVIPDHDVNDTKGVFQAVQNDELPSV